MCPCRLSWIQSGAALLLAMSLPACANPLPATKSSQSTAASTQTITLPTMIRHATASATATSAASTIETSTPALTATPLSVTGLGQIAFVSDRDGDDEIYVMNTDGSGVRRVTDNTASDRNLDASPDG